MAQHEFRLPVPPTANLLWRFLIIAKVIRAVPSKVYKEWKKRVEPFFPAADKERYADSPQLSWGFWFWLNINHGSDIDNRIKATVDAVAGHYGLHDQWLDELHVYRAKETPIGEPLAPGEGLVYLRVSEK